MTMLAGTNKIMLNRKMRRRMRGVLHAWLRRSVGRGAVVAIVAAAPSGWFLGHVLVSTFGANPFLAGAVATFVVVPVVAAGALGWEARRQRAYSKALRVWVAAELGVDLDDYAEERELLRRRGPKRPLTVRVVDPVKVSS